MRRASIRSLSVDFGLVGGPRLPGAPRPAGQRLPAALRRARARAAPALLPVYLLRSLARLAVAYAVAVLLALAIGHLAARSPFARRLILPTLDVLQSVPILGFFPAAVAVFIALFGGSALGVEAAAVFLIFT